MALWQGQSKNFFQIFSHSRQTALNRLLHRSFAHALSHSYLPIALAEDHTGIHPAALRFG